MRTIKFNARAARLLRENLTASQEGYEYVDLLKLDSLAKKLTELQGEYATRMAELAREEKAIRRATVKAAGQADLDVAQRSLLAIQFEAEDLNDAADATPVEIAVTEGEYKLIQDKLDNVPHWNASDALRPVIIAMVEAVRNAESDEPEEDKKAEPRQLRRR